MTAASMFGRWRRFPAPGTSRLPAGDLRVATGVVGGVESPVGDEQRDTVEATGLARWLLEAGVDGIGLTKTHARSSAQWFVRPPSAELLNARGVLARLAVLERQHLTSLHDAIQQAFGWWADLCGGPHKSAYAESRVMPTASCDPGSLGPDGSQARHNADR